MADKSLFDLAKELYQGFGNNPANRELANTLTFRAPVVRELNPIVTIPRGIEALRNTNFSTILDAARDEAYGRSNPGRTRAASGELLNMFEGALDAAPVLGLIKPTIAGAKMAAPHIAEAGVRQLNRLEEKYGLPTSPVMNIVKPEGNLNFTTRLDEQIRGPETQTVFDLLKQVQGKPGVTKEGLKKLAQNYPDTAAKISKQEFKENIPASYYRKEDLAGDNETVFNNYLMEAMEGGLNQAQTYHNLGIPESLHSSLDDLLSNELYFDDLDPQQQQDLRRLFGISEHETDDDAFEDIVRRIDEQQQEEAYEYAMDRTGGSQEKGYSYQDFQRLVGKDEPGYFEFGVTHPEQMMKESTGQARRYTHYSNESMPGGLIGHVRGTHLKEPAAIQGNIDVPANSYIIEEIQSDAQKGVEQTGALHQAHGTMFKAAVQDALEKGADRIYLPTSYPISKVRNKHPEEYASIYDKAIVKEGLEPLSKIPGVEIRPIFKELESEHFFQNHPDYHEITISPEAREYILTGPGQSIPGYAAGGLVASDYDDEHIDRMSDEIMNFGKGGLFKAIGKLVEPTAQVVKKVKEGQEIIPRYTKDEFVSGLGKLQSNIESKFPESIHAIDEDKAVKLYNRGFKLPGSRIAPPGQKYYKPFTHAQTPGSHFASLESPDQLEDIMQKYYKNPLAKLNTEGVGFRGKQPTAGLIAADLQSPILISDEAGEFFPVLAKETGLTRLLREEGPDALMQTLRRMGVEGGVYHNMVEGATDEARNLSYTMFDPTKFKKVPTDANINLSTLEDAEELKLTMDRMSNIENLRKNALVQMGIPSNLHEEFDQLSYGHTRFVSPEAKSWMEENNLTPDSFTKIFDKLSSPQQDFAKGGKVTGQPHENEYVKAAGKYSRKAQGMAASLIPGLRPILDKAQDLPLKYYAATGEHNGEADAMRHMLLQAQLLQKYGETPAKAIGWLHENISFGQPEREKTMDEYNDVLGREIGAKAKSEQEMIDMARQYIDSKKAKSIKQDNSPDGYAQGGLVYNDAEINNLADQLLGA